MAPSESSSSKRKPGRPSKSESLAPLWRELIEAAEAFRAATPWMSFSNLQYFGVNLPEDECALACVLGNGGETFGVVLYEGSGMDQALRMYRAARAGTDGPPTLDVAYIFESRYLRLEFVSEKELPAARRKQLLASGWTPPLRRAPHDDSPAWLYFESGVPGSEPKPLDAGHEIIRLTLALRQVVALMKHRGRLAKFDCDAGVWSTEEDDIFPFLPNNGETGDFGWRRLRRRTPALTFPFELFAEAKKIPVIDEIWEIARALTISVEPQKVRGSDRRWFDRILFVGRFADPAGMPTPLFVDMSAVHGDADDAARLNLIEACAKAGGRPTLLLYDDDSLAAAIAPLCDALGIPLQKSKNTLGVTETLKMMNEGFLPSE